MAEDWTLLRSQFDTLSKGAYLDVLLPKSPDFNAGALVKDGSSEELARAPSRRNLFFDESANIVLVLRTAADAETVRGLLPTLEIVLAAHATDAVPQGTGNSASASGKHDLNSKALRAADSAEVVVAGDQTYVIWTLTLDLTRPRARLQRPAIYFTANLSLRSGETDVKAEKDYLKPFEPLSRNVLEPLSTASDFRGTHVYMSEDRITKVAPKPLRREDTVRPIRGATKRAFPTTPALYTRLKFTIVPDAVIASLHLETSQVLAGTVSVDDIQVKVSAATDYPRGEVNASEDADAVQCLTDASLPMTMSPGDETVLLYRLPRGRHDNGALESAILNVNVHATATLEEGSHTKLDLVWQYPLDKQEPVVDRTYSWSKHETSLNNKAERPPSMPSTMPASQDNSSLQSDAGAGVTFFFTAPETTNQYDDFHLSVKCINRSTQARQFALRPTRMKQSSLATQPYPKSDNGDLVAGIFQAPALQRKKPEDIFCHTPNVNIGPIPPGASYDTTIDVRALTTGVLNMGTIRIQDLDSQQTVDVADLPDIIALEALEGGTPYASSKFMVRAQAGSKIKPPLSTLENDAKFWGKAVPSRSFD
ncbi:hypothetical protein LTR56_024778 [Elasticomyces elasticus]|nr:hypothetical protein LTR56_024778 [Elasticomyces elasticus]KAK3622068.1 hypothetical protein LTR22_024957 [Elasticomyces elasticus]KAK4905244.1 hypothetical protein LTR49_025434 [Elasticomyces elasticus]KAK5747651.1 hypothetical protein LTS12_022307 [Elasticomyces elasticus]